MLEEGTYKARAVEADLGLTNGGKEQVAVLLEIIDGPRAGSRITWFGLFTPGTQSRTLDALRLLGWDSDSLEHLSGINKNEVSIVVEHETFQGQLKARVKWINAAAGLGLRTRMGEREKKIFAERMRGAVVAHRAASRVATSTTAKADEPPPWDDDAPF